MSAQGKTLADWLAELIAIPSVTGNEAAALDHLARAFSVLAPEVFSQPFPADLAQHEEYIHDPGVADLMGRRNLIVRWPGNTPGRRLVLQTHVDTVPYTGWDDGVRPRVEGKRLIGRGACDCKGQIALLYRTVQLLGGRNFAPPADLELQIVSEEEIGGNGALAAVLGRPPADGVVVLEPTQLQLFAANRGALWFQIDIEGRATHMGRKWEGVNAVELGCEVVALLNEYEKRHVEESRNVPLFEHYAIPVQVNIGMMQGGDWPAMVPAHCHIEGGVGFLPNKNRSRIRRELEALFAGCANPWLRSHLRLRFDRLRNEAFITPVDHPLVTGMSAALRRHDLDGTPLGWNVSCDARLYATVGEQPVVVFGAGNIAHAHAVGEEIDLDELERGARVLADFVRAWYG